MYVIVTYYWLVEKVIAVPVLAWTGPAGSSFQDSWHMKVVRCQPYALATSIPQEAFLVFISVRG